MILLDTTVLSYAIGEEHVLLTPCRRILRAHGDGVLDATTTVEVIQEFTHVRARRRTRGDAVHLARSYAAAFELLTAGQDDLELGLSLFETHPELGAFDAVLAAVALNRRVEALVSADRAFAAVPGLMWIDPATSELDRLIASATAE